MIRPIGKNILVKRKPSEEKKGGLIVPQQWDEPFETLVVDIGNKADVDFFVGDVVLLVRFCGSRISKQEDGFLLITEKDILGVVKQ